ncbi:MAG TPA: response regulator [Myxococcota bacterium]|nr:response regulator [Myxococcota bacterium]HRY96290.1 response regulator [Myxococcota bacterium]HSA22354.1 response regulator [Myxococcota bacterium]
MRGSVRKAVMIVEDDPQRRKYFFEILDLTRVDVLSAVDAEEAMRLARRQQPELILLNMFSDKTDGVSFLKQLRCFGLGQKMIVLGMVGDEDEKAHAAASNAGPDKLLERQPAPHLVLELVAGYLGIKKIEVPPRMVPTVGRTRVEAAPAEALAKPDQAPGSEAPKPIIRSLSNLLMLTDDAGKQRKT